MGAVVRTNGVLSHNQRYQKIERFIQHVDVKIQHLKIYQNGLVKVITDEKKVLLHRYNVHLPTFTDQVHFETYLKCVYFILSQQDNGDYVLRPLLRLQGGGVNQSATKKPQSEKEAPAKRKMISEMEEKQLLNAASQKNMGLVSNMLQNINFKNLAIKQTTANQVLLHAAHIGNETIVFQLIDGYGASPGPALHYASCYGHKALVQRLLDAGVKPNAPALYGACSKGYIEIVKALIAAGVDVNGEGNKSPLVICLEKGHHAIYDLLIEQGATVKAKMILRMIEDMCQDKFSASERKAHRDKIITFMNLCVDFNPKDKGCAAALFKACMYGEVVIVQRLIKSGVNVNKPYNSDRYPITIAVCCGYYEIVVLLIENGATLNGSEGHLLNMACKAGHEEIAKILMKHGATFNRASLSIAVENGLPSIVKRLLAGGAKIETEGYYAKNFLGLIFSCYMSDHKGKENDYRKTVNILIENGVNIQDVKFQGSHHTVTPLVRAAGHGWEDTVALLLKRGADYAQIPKSEYKSLSQEVRLVLQPSLLDNEPAYLDVIKSLTEAIMEELSEASLAKLKSLVKIDMSEVVEQALLETAVGFYFIAEEKADFIQMKDSIVRYLSEKLDGLLEKKVSDSDKIKESLKESIEVWIAKKVLKQKKIEKAEKEYNSKKKVLEDQLEEQRNLRNQMERALEKANDEALKAAEERKKQTELLNSINKKLY